MLGRQVADLVQQKKNGDFSFPFQHVQSVIKKADIAFGNLESPISGRGKAIDKAFTFNAPKESIRSLSYAGFDIVSLANNHILDFGVLALEDTRFHLEKNGIHYIGLISDQKPYQEPVILKAGELRIGFLAYADPKALTSYPKVFMKFSPRPAPLEKEQMTRDIHKLKSQCDLIVISLHWGTEFRYQPDDRQIELARWAIDQGATILVGHHPHFIQPIERYKNGVILYSLGNFVFDLPKHPKTWHSEMITITVNKAHSVENIESIPIWINDNWQPMIKE